MRWDPSCAREGQACGHSILSFGYARKKNSPRRLTLRAPVHLKRGQDQGNHSFVIAYSQMWAVRLRAEQRRWHGYARVGGDGGAGFWVCAADIAAEPGICGGGGADFGVGDRGEHGDFYSARPGFVAAAAGEKSAAVGAADHAREALREQLGRQ